jgi:hypothetical protein
MCLKMNITNLKQINNMITHKRSHIVLYSVFPLLRDVDEQGAASIEKTANSYKICHKTLW